MKLALLLQCGLIVPQSLQGKQTSVTLSQSRGFVHQGGCRVTSGSKRVGYAFGGESGKTLRDTKRSPPSNVQQKRRGRTHHLGVDRTDLIRSANGTRRKPLDSNAAVAQVKSFCGREVYFLLFGPAMAREQ